MTLSKGKDTGHGPILEGPRRLQVNMKANMYVTFLLGRHLYYELLVLFAQSPPVLLFPLPGGGGGESQHRAPEAERKSPTSLDSRPSTNMAPDKGPLQEEFDLSGTLLAVAMLGKRGTPFYSDVR